MDNPVTKILTVQLPDYFKPIIEFQKIMEAYGYALDRFETEMEHVYSNNYIATADDNTLSFWEKNLGLYDSYGKTLEYRRERILQRFNIVPPFSIGYLRAKLDELFYGEYELNADSSQCTLQIKVTSDRYEALNMLYVLLWDIIPAHLQIKADQEITNDSRNDLYAAGFASCTCIQTIGPVTINQLVDGIYTSDFVTNTMIQTIG